MEALDRTRLLSDVATVLSDHHVNILSATSTTDRDRIVKLRFTFELADIAHLSDTLSSREEGRGRLRRLPRRFPVGRPDDAGRSATGGACIGDRATARNSVSIGTGLLCWSPRGATTSRTRSSGWRTRSRRLRVFADADGKMNLALTDVDGEVLVVSQFTLVRRCAQGPAPFVDRRGAAGGRGGTRRGVRAGAESSETCACARGRFRAHMEVELLNDGPVTLVLDGSDLFG